MATMTLETLIRTSRAVVNPPNWRLFAVAMRVRSERRRLAMLDDNRLADLGLNREQVDAEAARPFWDLPAHRR